MSVNDVLQEYNEMREEILKLYEVRYINMLVISRKTYEKNGVQTIVDNDRILWLNGKHRRRTRSWKFACDYIKISFRS